MLNINEQTGRTVTEGGVIANRTSFKDISQKRMIIG